MEKLRNAAFRGDLQAVETGLKDGGNPTTVLAQVSHGQSCPNAAAIYDYLRAARASPLDEKQAHDAMLYAAGAGRVDLLECLHRDGVPTMGKAKADGNAPLTNAVWTGRGDALGWLIAHGADSNRPVNCGKGARVYVVPLDMAMGSSRLDHAQKQAMIERLVEHGADPDRMQGTALRWQNVPPSDADALKAHAQHHRLSRAVAVERANAVDEPEEDPWRPQTRRHGLRL
jgi:hypothetical protein